MTPIFRVQQQQFGLIADYLQHRQLILMAFILRMKVILLILVGHGQLLQEQKHLQEMKKLL